MPGGRSGFALARAKARQVAILVTILALIDDKSRHRGGTRGRYRRWAGSMCEITLAHVSWLKFEGQCLGVGT